MVQTRRQWRSWIQQAPRPAPAPQQSYHDMAVANDYYHQRDVCHRHRKRDRQPYTQRVKTYRRRAPVS